MELWHNMVRYNISGTRNKMIKSLIKYANLTSGNPSLEREGYSCCRQAGQGISPSDYARSLYIAPGNTHPSDTRIDTPKRYKDWHTQATQGLTHPSDTRIDTSKRHKDWHTQATQGLTHPSNTRIDTPKRHKDWHTQATQFLYFCF